VVLRDIIKIGKVTLFHSIMLEIFRISRKEEPVTPSARF